MRVGLAALALLGLCGLHASIAIHKPIGWDRFCAHPAESAGQRLVMPLYTVERVDSPTAVVIGKVATGIPITLPVPLDLQPGDTISVAGAFDPSGPRVVADVYELHPHRKAKEALGVLGLGLGLLALPAGFVRRGRFLVERDLG